MMRTEGRERTFVIVGNGIAGMTAAETLRARDAEAHIILVADDTRSVFYRPALKDFLAGRVREEALRARPEGFYQQQRIQGVTDRVVGIYADQHIIQLQSGRQLAYNRLLLANGARPNTLNCPGAHLAGVTTLRGIEDYRRVLSGLSALQGTGRIVVVGGGTLGLESVESLRSRGYAVSHLLRHNTLWPEVLDETASDLVLQQEMRAGADVHLEEEVVEITGEQGRVNGVVTTKGIRIPCDMVLVAIGIAPNIEVLQRSGILCGRGVRVDAHMRTSAPDVYAAGDIVETVDALTGRARVIGQWYPAVQQARAAAFAMLDMLNNSRPFQPANFYNATFLYGLDFASVGLTGRVNGPLQTIIAGPRPRQYRKVVLANGIPVGMLSLGDRRGALAFKRAIDHRVNLSPVAAHLFAPHFNLSDWLDSQRVPPPVPGVQTQHEQFAPTG